MIRSVIALIHKEHKQQVWEEWIYEVWRRGTYWRTHEDS